MLERCIPTGHTRMIAYTFACITARAGEIDRCFDYIDDALANGDSIYSMRNDTDFANVHNHPRFLALLAETVWYFGMLKLRSFLLKGNYRDNKLAYCSKLDGGSGFHTRNLHLSVCVRTHRQQHCDVSKCSHYRTGCIHNLWIAIWWNRPFIDIPYRFQRQQAKGDDWYFDESLLRSCVLGAVDAIVDGPSRTNLYGRGTKYPEPEEPSIQWSDVCNWRTDRHPYPSDAEGNYSHHFWLPGYARVVRVVASKSMDASS